MTALSATPSTNRRMILCILWFSTWGLGVTSPYAPRWSSGFALVVRAAARC